jgi:hypothetical protein
MNSMSENMYVAEIEAKLIGMWASDDNKITYNFFPTVDIETPGQLDISHHDDFNIFEYRIFINENIPHLTVIDAASNKRTIYTIKELNVVQQILKLVAESGEILVLDKK